MEQEIFVIVQHGCEGIESLVYASHDGQQAADKLKSIRKDINEAINHRQKVLKEFGEEQDEDFNDAWDRLFYDGKIGEEENNNSRFRNPDSYCLQKWDGKNFYCVCKAFDCKPEKNWIT